MGRKFKIAFSNTEKDTALTFMHDLGAIARIRTVDGNLQRGFKILIGGGLGAQPHLAICTHEFLEETLLIPYLEAVLRVFDRHGERNSRHKARIKFLIQKIGIETFNQLVQEEQLALTHQRVEIMSRESGDGSREPGVGSRESGVRSRELSDKPGDSLKYELWKKTNLFKQKQEGYYAVYVRVPNGNISSDVSRRLIAQLEGVIADDIRVTINQGLQFRFVKPENLSFRPGLWFCFGYYQLSRYRYLQPRYQQQYSHSPCIK